jgi:hypothetical protein
MSFEYRKEALSIEEAVMYLEKFDANNKIHVDKIESPEGGQLYMFYSDDDVKLRKLYLTKKEIVIINETVFLRRLEIRWCSMEL